MLASKHEVRLLAFLGFVLFVFLIIAYVVGHKDLAEEKAAASAAASPFTKVALTAKAAFVYDVKTEKTLYAKNEDLRLPLASLTKVMTALTASTLAPSYSTIVITKEAVATSGDSGLLTGEHWFLQDLLDFSLVSSSNDGARAVALSLGGLTNSTSSVSAIENDFIHKMNAEADAIGMKNTYFINDTGLDESLSQGGAYGTARDIVTLFDYILKNKPRLISATRERQVSVVSIDGFKHIAVNTDLDVGDIPGLIASKTGYTDLAGGNLVVALDPELGHPIIIAVLGSSAEGRFEDMLMLVQASLESLNNNVLYSKP